MTKWFIDCITMGAIMNTVAFLVLMGIMKGQSGAQIGNNIRTVSSLLEPPCAIAAIHLFQDTDTCRAGNHPHHRRRLQGLALCFHHQLHPHPRRAPHRLPQRRRPLLGHLHVARRRARLTVPTPSSFFLASPGSASFLSNFFF